MNISSSVCSPKRTEMAVLGLGLGIFIAKVFLERLSAIINFYNLEDKGARLEEIEVESIRFSEYVIKNKLKNILVKVDIEGAEQDFIDGARECMDKVSYLIIEVLGEASRNGFVKRVIDEFKLNAYYINDFNLMYSADGSYKYIAPEYNWFFCNKNPSQLKETLNSNLISVYCDGVKI